MTDVFQAVKEAVTMPLVAEYYGFKAGRHNYICCPFHAEKTGSCKLYEHSFHCFGCGAGGDVIKFVQLLFKLSPIDAVKRLNTDFNIGIDVSQPTYSIHIGEILRRRQAEQAFREWEKQAFISLSTYLRLLKQWRKEYAPLCSDSFINPLFSESLQQLDRVQYLCDLLTFGTVQDKQKFYTTCREEVKAIESRLQEYSRQRAG